MADEEGEGAVHITPWGLGAREVPRRNFRRLSRVSGEKV